MQVLEKSEVEIKQPLRGDHPDVKEEVLRNLAAILSEIKCGERNINEKTTVNLVEWMRLKRAIVLRLPYTVRGGENFKKTTLGEVLKYIFLHKQ